jgi:CHAT domain-containing protein/tetratricopeptide (TPR) repeat protein
MTDAPRLRFDPAGAAASARRLRAAAWRGSLLSGAGVLLLVILAGRFSVALYGQTLLQQATKAGEGGLRHEALRLRQRALRYGRIASWPDLDAADRGEVARELALVAQSQARVGDLASALTSVRESVRLAETARNPELLAIAKVVMGILQLRFDPDAARASYLEAYELYSRGRDLSQDPSIHLRLATCALAGRDPAGALAEVERAEALAPDDYTVGMHRALVLAALGRTDEAVALLDPTLLKNAGRPVPATRLYSTPLSQRSDWGRHYDGNFVLLPDAESMYPVVMADLLLRLGLPKEAEPYVWGMKPFVGSEVMANPLDLAEYYASVGWHRELMAKAGDAVELHLLAIRWFEEYRRRLPDDLRARFFAEDIHSLPYRHLAGIAAKLPPEAAPEPALGPYGRTNLEVAVYFAEATKARTFMEMVAAREQHTAGGVPEDLRAREAALLAERRNRQRALEAAIAEGGFTPITWTKESVKVADPPAALVEAERRLNGTNQSWVAFEDELYRKAPRYAALTYPRPVPLGEVPIAEGETVIEYSLNEDETIVFVLDGPSRREALILPIGASRVRELVAGYLTPIRNGQLSPRAEVGSALHAALVAPVLARVPAGRRLVIVPDGALWTLPFEILPAGAAGGMRLGDAWSVTYSPSLAMLALNRLTGAPAPTKPFFGVGDVAFGGPPGADGTRGGLALRGIYIDRAQQVFPPLPETRREVERAAGVFGVTPAPPDVLMAGDATETRVKRTALAEYRVLHLATHGIANADLANVREPALLFAPDAENDGILRASEVAGLRLGASTVVLAACKTGLGEDLGGEGVMSLARAFQHAGARTVVMSLWNVPSEVTETLFASFYRELQAGRGPADALRAARLDVRRTHPEPFFWGGFTIVGEGR